MLRTLAYERSVVTETAGSAFVTMGCAHLGQTGKHRNGAVYGSDKADVCFYGYLSTPSPAELKSKAGNRGGGWEDSAHYVHDLYIDEGDSFIEQIDGNFVVAIYDKQQDILLLGNSRPGLLPIYYAESRHDLLFASEVKAILQDKNLPRHLNMASVADFFSFGCVLGIKTFFEEIRLLPPASILRYYKGEYSVKKYWDLVFPDSYPKRPDRWYQELISYVVSRAVERMIEPEQRYGVKLSGGMDSRWLAALLSQRCPSLSTFTFGPPDCDDVILAQQVAERLGTEHHWFPLEATYISEYGDKIVYIDDGMCNVFSAHAFPMSIQLWKYIDIGVGGLLGGVLFGHYANPIVLMLRKSQTLEYFLKQMRPSLSADNLRRLFGGRRYHEFEEMTRQSAKETLGGIRSDIPANIMDYHYFGDGQRRGTFMGQLLKTPYLDMRYPFCDRQVIEAALQLPPWQRCLEQAYCRSFSQAFPQLADIPWERTLLPPAARMPLLLSRMALKKVAHSHAFLFGRIVPKWEAYGDYDSWTRGPLRSFIESTLIGQDSNKLELFDGKYLQQLVEEHMEGKRNISQFLGLLLTFELWSKMFFQTSSPKPPGALTFAPDPQE